MIKVFTLNKNGKIELTKEQLKSLLNEAYYEGKGYHGTYIYTTPYYNIDPASVITSDKSITATIKTTGNIAQER